MRNKCHVPRNYNFLVFFFVVFSIYNLALFSDSRKDKTRDDIAEAVIRYRLQTKFKSLSEPTAAALIRGKYRIFVSLVGDSFQDPSPEFMERFKDTDLISVVSKASFRSPDGLVINKETSCACMIFQINKIVIIDEQTAEITSTIISREDLKSACSYQLRLKNNKWTIEDEKVLWVGHPPAQPEEVCRTVGKSIPDIKLDIAEAVFRYYFSRHNYEEKDFVFFLSIDGKDPSAEFMKRFEKDPLTIKPFSQCIEEKYQPCKDIATGNRGIRLGVGSINFVLLDNNIGATVYYVIDGGFTVFSSYNLILRYANGKWSVTKDTLWMIS